MGGGELGITMGIIIMIMIVSLYHRCKDQEEEKIDRRGEGGTRDGRQTDREVGYRHKSEGMK